MEHVSENVMCGNMRVTCRRAMARSRGLDGCAWIRCTSWSRVNEKAEYTSHAKVLQNIDHGSVHCKTEWWTSTVQKLWSQRVGSEPPDTWDQKRHCELQMRFVVCGTHPLRIGRFWRSEEACQLFSFPSHLDMGLCYTCGIPFSGRHSRGHRIHVDFHNAWNGIFSLRYCCECKWSRRASRIVI